MNEGLSYPVHFILSNEPPVPTGLEAGWTSGSVGTLWGREPFIVPAGDRVSIPPSNYADWAISVLSIISIFHWNRVMCISHRCLAVAVYSFYIIPAFSGHVTLYQTNAFKECLGIAYQTKQVCYRSRYNSVTGERWRNVSGVVCWVGSDSVTHRRKWQGQALHLHALYKLTSEEPCFSIFSWKWSHPTLAMCLVFLRTSLSSNSVTLIRERKILIEFALWNF